ncbi:hypothetical protein ACFL4T_13015 [candidate division KSB1 bacterium]
MIVKFKEFRGLFDTWDNLYKDAADYASKIGKDKLINISQAVHAMPVVTVWYWGVDEPSIEVK